MPASERAGGEWGFGAIAGPGRRAAGRHSSRFAKVYFDPNAAQDQLYAVLAPVVDRFRGMSGEEQIDFLGQLTDYRAAPTSRSSGSP